MASPHPNFVYILADDMGYGDVACLNPDCAFPTPNLDRLGREGVAFTDAHSSSSVCTPSRYSILTGRYCWRTYLKRSVLGGTGLPLIEPDRPTVASLFRAAGYRTACVGKWHVGWEWAVKDGHAHPGREGWASEFDWIDFTRPIEAGPTTRGFDWFYGISGSLDMPPYVYVENDMPVEPPTARGTAEEFVREGPRMESLRAHNVLGHLTGKAVDSIERQTADVPFFLYFPLTAPHTPIAPAAGFAGKSGINPYADFCMEVDHRVGQVLDALDRRGLTDDTVVIFTTDNGASAGPSQCARLERQFGHHCSHIYRGYKSDIWDGGHRLPFLVRWPRGADAGSRCDQRIGIFDFFATVADITGQKLPVDAGEDSVSFLPGLRGEPIDETRREGLIHHSIDGRFAIRRGQWKLCRCPGSGGWGVNDMKDDEARRRGLPELQLYHMSTDPGETTNLCLSRPEIVRELTEALHRCVIRGRSTPGEPRENSPEIPLADWEQIDWLPEIPERCVIDD